MNKIHVNIKFDNIYSFAIGEVRCQGEQAYTIKFDQDIRIISLESGTLTSRNTLCASEDQGKYVLEFSCVGLVIQRAFRQMVEDTGLDSYGMQYYPFISSEIVCRASTQNAIVDTLTVNLPDAYRVVWFRQDARQNGKLATMNHSQGEEQSVYVFYWNDDEYEISGSDLNLRLPVRLGGREYLRILLFPAWYYLLSLVGVFLLALQDKPNVTFGGVAAAWVLMLRHFNRANAPQLNTVLRDIYVILGLFLLLWAIAWEAIGYFALVFVVPIVLVVRIFTKITQEFKREGVLPRKIETFLFAVRYKNEQRNKANNRLNVDG